MQDYILELPAFNPTRKFFNQFWTIKQPNFSWFTCFSLVILGVLGKYIWVNHWIFCKIWGGMPKLCWIFFLWWLPSASAIASTKHVRACAVTYLVSMTFWKSDATTYFLLNRQLMEARMIFLLQPAVKPDLDLTRPLIQMLFSYVDILMSEETHVKC